MYANLYRQGWLGRIDVCGAGCDAAVAKVLAVATASKSAEVSCKEGNGHRKGWVGVADDEQRWHDCCKDQGTHLAVHNLLRKGETQIKSTSNGI